MNNMLATAVSTLVLLSSLARAASAGPPGRPHPLKSEGGYRPSGSTTDLDPTGGVADLLFESGPKGGVVRPQNGAAFARPEGLNTTNGFKLCESASYEARIRSIAVPPDAGVSFCVHTNEGHIAVVSFSKLSGQNDDYAIGYDTYVDAPFPSGATTHFP